MRDFNESLKYHSFMIDCFAGSAAVFSGPRASAIGCNFIDRWLAPIPVTNDVFKRTSELCLIATTRTSVSGEWIVKSVAPSAVASRARSIIFVSASSWSLWRCPMSLWVASHSFPHATTSCLLKAWPRSFTFFARKAVSSALVFVYESSFFNGTFAIWVESLMR